VLEEPSTTTAHFLRSLLIRVTVPRLRLAAPLAGEREKDASQCCSPTKTQWQQLQELCRYCRSKKSVVVRAGGRYGSADDVLLQPKENNLGR
jgi:hypothetical protein